MSQGFNIRINRSDLESVNRSLAGIRNGSQKALVKSINKTLTTTKVQVRKKLASLMALPAKRIGQNISVAKANYTRIEGRLIVVGKPVPLIEFKPTKTKKGLKARIYKSNPKSLIESSFKARMRSGHIGAFRRVIERGRRV